MGVAIDVHNTGSWAQERHRIGQPELYLWTPYPFPRTAKLDFLSSILALSL